MKQRDEFGRGLSKQGLCTSYNTDEKVIVSDETHEGKKGSRRRIREEDAL